MDGRSRWRRSVLVVVGAAMVGGVWGACGGDGGRGNVAPDGGGEGGLSIEERAGLQEFDQFRAGFDVLQTLAGAGAREDDVNEWKATFEGGTAILAELSSPHAALGDGNGNVFIADKEAHAIRRVAPDGLISTVAGVNEPGDDGDLPGPGRLLHLNQPNGIWIGPEGTLYILDLGNQKVRRLDGAGEMTTLFSAPGLTGGRGLWVAIDESVAYLCSGGDLLRWTPQQSVQPLATGFIDLGNITVTVDGTLLVTDRGQHRVFRVSPAGVVDPFAGSGAAGPALDGQAALAAPLDEVRGIWPAPVGGLLLATHHGSQVLYLDSFGFIHILIDGVRRAHCCDGEPLTRSGLKVSEARHVSLTPAGDLLVTENDAGYVRVVRHLR